MRKKRTTPTDRKGQPVNGNHEPDGARQALGAPDLPLPTDGNKSNSSNAPQPRRSPSRHSLSRRIAGWSGNLLATAVIVILGITFGRQVLRWWHDEPPSVSAVRQDLTNDLGGLADPDVPHVLAFGELPYTFDRVAFEGDESAALARLRDACRAVAIDFDATRQSPLSVSSEFLRSVSAHTAVEQNDKWRIVQNAGPVITVVALHKDAALPPSRTDVASHIHESVVSWGIGLRVPEAEAEKETSQKRWTLFTCVGARHKVGSDLDLSLPIPPQSQRTLALRVKDGGALLGFSGQGTAAAAKQFYDQQLSERGWTRVTQWTPIGTTWHTRFERPESGVCDIQIVGRASGETNGILTLAPVAQHSEK